MTKRTLISLLIAAALPIASANAAKVSDTGTNATRSQMTMTLSPKQRGEAISRFIRAWGPYVQQVYGLNVGTWSKRMISQFASGDALNIQRALKRTTFEGAMAELTGSGKALSDKKVIDTLAASKSISVGADSLGSLTGDLVFTPITPCRIADTRLAGGPIAADSVRGFGAWGYSTYTAWGGSATNCGMASDHPTAVVLNVTAVTPTAAGYATVFSYAIADAARPVISSINYTAGAVVNNSVVAGINPAVSLDYKIYTFAQSDYVVDIIGFFAAPHATALDCVDVPGAATVIPAGPNSFTSVSAPACASDYTQVSLNCDTNNFNTNLAGQRASTRTCFFTNQTGSAYSATATTRCCRVPGR
jgi:hypothetical protein